MEWVNGKCKKWHFFGIHKLKTIAIAQLWRLPWENKEAVKLFLFLIPDQVLCSALPRRKIPARLTYSPLPGVPFATTPSPPFCVDKGTNKAKVMRRQFRQHVWLIVIHGLMLSSYLRLGGYIVFDFNILSNF